MYSKEKIEKEKEDLKKILNQMEHRCKRSSRIFSKNTMALLSLLNYFVNNKNGVFSTIDCDIWIVPKDYTNETIKMNGIKLEEIIIDEF